MKKLLITACMVVTNTIIAPTTAQATGIPATVGKLLVGDEKLACEAILCLASGVQPAACQPSLSRYFNIVKRTVSATLTARVNFLNLCPVVSSDAVMSNFVGTLARGAGRCDAASLNATMQSWTGDFRYVSNTLPEYCSAYSNHAYTNVANTMPRYVGTPERGGYWVDPDKYEQAYAEWLARIQAEDAERTRQSLHGN